MKNVQVCYRNTPLITLELKHVIIMENELSVSTEKHAGGDMQ